VADAEEHTDQTLPVSAEFLIHLLDRLGEVLAEAWTNYKNVALFWDFATSSIQEVGACDCLGVDGLQYRSKVGGGCIGSPCGGKLKSLS
jgi:hypothetical protein